MIFGWDVHLGSVSDERRRRVGRDARARSVVPYPGWCGQTCTRGRGQSVSETRVGSRIAGPRRSRASRERGASVIACIRRGYPLNRARVGAARCLSVIPKKGLNTSLPRATSPVPGPILKIAESLTTRVGRQCYDTSTDTAHTHWHVVVYGPSSPDPPPWRTSNATLRRPPPPQHNNPRD